MRQLKLVAKDLPSIRSAKNDMLANYFTDKAKMK